jgi:hypothetical protein
LRCTIGLKIEPMEENNSKQFEPVEPLQLAHGTCMHESVHTTLSSNAADGVRSALVVSSRMSMHAVDGALEVRFVRHAFLHPQMAVQVRK